MPILDKFRAREQEVTVSCFLYLTYGDVGNAEPLLLISVNSISFHPPA